MPAQGAGPRMRMFPIRTVPCAHQRSPNSEERLSHGRRKSSCRPAVGQRHLRFGGGIRGVPRERADRLVHHVQPDDGSATRAGNQPCCGQLRRRHPLSGGRPGKHRTRLADESEHRQNHPSRALLQGLLGRGHRGGGLRLRRRVGRPDEGEQGPRPRWRGGPAQGPQGDSHHGRLRRSVRRRRQDRIHSAVAQRPLLDAEYMHHRPHRRPLFPRCPAGSDEGHPDRGRHTGGPGDRKLRRRNPGRAQGPFRGPIRAPTSPTPGTPTSRAGSAVSRRSPGATSPSARVWATT